MDKSSFIETVNNIFKVYTGYGAKGLSSFFKELFSIGQFPGTSNYGFKTTSDVYSVDLCTYDELNSAICRVLGKKGRKSVVLDGKRYMKVVSLLAYLFYEKKYDDKNVLDLKSLNLTKQLEFISDVQTAVNTYNWSTHTDTVCPLLSKSGQITIKNVENVLFALVLLLFDLDVEEDKDRETYNKLIALHNNITELSTYTEWNSHNVLTQIIANYLAQHSFWFTSEEERRKAKNFLDAQIKEKAIISAPIETPELFMLDDENGCYINMLLAYKGVERDRSRVSSILSSALPSTLSNSEKQVFIIEGDAGMGKTVLLRKLFIHYALQLENSGYSLDYPFPLFLSCKDYEYGSSILHFIENTTQLDSVFLEKILKKSVIFIDGFDEIPSSNFMHSLILFLQKHVTNTKIVISSRPNVFSFPQKVKVSQSILTIQAFDDTQLKNYVNNLLKNNICIKADARYSVESFFTALKKKEQENEKYKRTSRSPLLVASILQQYLRSGTLPDNHIDAMHKAINRIFERDVNSSSRVAKAISERHKDLLRAFSMIRVDSIFNNGENRSQILDSYSDSSYFETYIMTHHYERVHMSYDNYFIANGLYEFAKEAFYAGDRDNSKQILNWVISNESLSKSQVKEIINILFYLFGTCYPLTRKIQQKKFLTFFTNCIMWKNYRPHNSSLCETLFDSIQYIYKPTNNGEMFTMEALQALLYAMSKFSELSIKSVVGKYPSENPLLSLYFYLYRYLYSSIEQNILLFENEGLNVTSLRNLQQSLMVSADKNIYRRAANIEDSPLFEDVILSPTDDNYYSIRNALNELYHLDEELEETVMEEVSEFTTSYYNTIFNPDLDTNDTDDNESEGFFSQFNSRTSIGLMFKSSIVNPYDDLFSLTIRIPSTVPAKLIQLACSNLVENSPKIGGLQARVLCELNYLLLGEYYPLGTNKFDQLLAFLSSRNLLRNDSDSDYGHLTTYFDTELCIERQARYFDSVALSKHIVRINYSRRVYVFLVRLVTIEKGNTKYSLDNNTCIMSKDKNEHIVLFPNIFFCEREGLIIPPSATKIMIENFIGRWLRVFDSIIVSTGNNCFCTDLNNVFLIRKDTGELLLSANNTVSIPSNNQLKAIGSYSLSMQTESIVIPEGITVIHDHAFCQCDMLSSISLPSTITTIESCIFDECRDHTLIIKYDGTVQQWGMILKEGENIITKPTKYVRDSGFLLLQHIIGIRVSVRQFIVKMESSMLMAFILTSILLRTVV